MNLDAFMIDASRRKPAGYNCYSFARELWALLKNEDLGDRIPAAVREYRAAVTEGEASRKMIPEPVSPCLVVFPQRRATPHIGVYLNGTVLHYEKSGPAREELGQLQARFGKARFYA